MFVGDTPLHFAASRKREATIAVLVTHGASLGQEEWLDKILEGLEHKIKMIILSYTICVDGDRKNGWIRS